MDAGDVYRLLSLVPGRPGLVLVNLQCDFNHTSSDHISRNGKERHENEVSVRLDPFEKPAMRAFLYAAPSSDILILSIQRQFPVNGRIILFIRQKRRRLQSRLCAILCSIIGNLSHEQKP